MKITIYNQAGTVKKIVESDSSSQLVREIGVTYNVILSFKYYEPFTLNLNDYIIVGNQKYKIKKDYSPKQINTQEYEYRVNLYGREHDAEDIKLCRLNDQDDLEVTFAYVATPLELLAKVVQNMNRNTYGIVWKVGTCIEKERQTFEFTDMYCWDALNQSAQQLETEWWVEGDYINLCKCETGDTVSLSYGAGLKSITPQDNNNAIKFFTRLIPLGSTKNIDKSVYGYERLQLPTRDKYIDLNLNYGLKEHVEENAFGEIYPHREGTISAVRSEVKTGNDNKQFTVYYVSDSALPFNPDEYMISGLVIHIVFNSGNLGGKDFECNWNSTTSEFEIINQYPDEESQLPGSNLIPAIGNKYVLYNLRQPAEYYTAAEQEYKTAVDSFLFDYSKDISIYSCETDYIYCDDNSVNLNLGQRVRLESSLYFADGYKDTRITKVVSNLDNINNATIQCCSVVTATWKSSVDSSINTLKYRVAETLEENTLLTVGDTRKATDDNAFSSLRSRAEFASKIKEDIFQELMTFNKGLKTKGAIDSFLSGTGVIIDGDRVQAGTLEARYSAIFRDVIFNRLSAQEGDTAFSDSGLIESLTLETDGTYTLHLRKRWENDFTSFQDNDILLGDVNDLMNNGTYYTSWVRVLSVNTANNSISVVVYPDAEVPGGVNHIPAELMRLVRRGNAVNTDKQGYWYLSATSEKCFVWLEGVNKPILEESNYYMMAGRPKNLSLFSNLPLSYQQAAFFARAAIVQNIFRVDVTGAPVVDVLPGVPWVRDTAYTSSNTQAQTVYHYGCRYQCIVPSTTQEPKYGATDWAMIEGNPSFTIEIESSNGWYFEPATLQTTLSVKGLLYNQNVTNDILDADVSWTRETGDITEDNAWAVSRANAGKSLPITVNDLGPNYMHQTGCKFKAVAVLRDGVQAENYITF